MPRSLLEYAVKYRDANITIRTQQAIGDIQIDATSNGPGVVVADLERIFEPYNSQAIPRRSRRPESVTASTSAASWLGDGRRPELHRSASETSLRLLIPVRDASADLEQQKVVSSA